jgi:Ala-tRNA(Pro) deacylase
MTVEDAKALRTGFDSEGHIKNLFLRNKKGKMWLFTLHEDTTIDLKQTAIAIGARRFSFGSPERLMEYLGVTPGAVSPFALLNDVHCEVEFYIDAILMEHSVIHAHPLDNRITVTLEREQLLQFLRSHDHPHKVFQ